MSKSDKPPVKVKHIPNPKCKICGSQLRKKDVCICGAKQ